MKSILGIGNALTDVLAILPDAELLRTYHLPLGSMQHVDKETGDRIWASLKEIGVQYVPGGSAANTITCTSIFGMPSGYIGKIGDDELGQLFKSSMEQFGVRATMLTGTKGSGRCMVFITGANAERTFASYMGAALEMGPEDLKPEYFKGYDYFHIEGYLVQNQELIARAVQMAREAGCIISIDMASYNVVEENRDFMLDLINNYVDIVFANEKESFALTGMEPEAALHFIAERCQIAVVKVGAKGALVQRGQEIVSIPPMQANVVDTTGAGDMWAAGFLAGLVKGENLEKCGMMGAIVAKNIIEVVGAKMNDQRWNDIHKAIALL